MLVIPALVELKPEYYYTCKASMGFILNARSPRLQRKPFSKKKGKEKKGAKLSSSEYEYYIKVLLYFLRS